MNPAPQLDVVMLMEFLASFMAVVFYFHRRAHRGANLALAVCVAVLAYCAFAHACWFLGCAETVWAFTAADKFFRFSKSPRGAKSNTRHREFHAPILESRIERLFGEVESN